MGKKINPKIFRISLTKGWTSRWFGVGQDYARQVEQDVKVKRYILREFKEAGIDKVEIERNANKITISVHTAKPGLIIGRGGKGADELKKIIHSKFLKNNFRLGDIKLNIFEVERPHLSAQILVQSMILDIEKRIPFRRVMKQAIARVERAGALGVKVSMSGRLNGVEIARTEKLASGKVPLHTLRANIDYARGAARTTYGTIGIKVWIYRGDIFDYSHKEPAKGEVIGNKKS
ncbi:30S ribosomal protein S3 [Candidatus Parcubacteria bacterium]|nr:MAG: 30S ribosomal protein S3 [Candidatus Parcubacteria bacterium]